MPETKPRPPQISWIRWSNAKLIADSRLPQASAFIPAIGYALLWSDQFEDLLGSQRLLGPSLLPPILKIRLLWWGAVLMTIGWFIYRYCCPPQVRRTGNPEDYVREQFMIPDTRRALAAQRLVRNLVAPYSASETSVKIYGHFPMALAETIQSVKDHTRWAYDAPNAASTGLLHEIEFHTVDHSRPIACGCSLALLCSGAGAFLIPSAEVTIRVLYTMLPPL